MLSLLTICHLCSLQNLIDRDDVPVFKEYAIQHEKKCFVMVNLHEPFQISVFSVLNCVFSPEICSCSLSLSDNSTEYSQQRSKKRISIITSDLVDEWLKSHLFLDERSDDMKIFGMLDIFFLERGLFIIGPGVQLLTFLQASNSNVKNTQINRKLEVDKSVFKIQAQRKKRYSICLNLMEKS